MSWFPSITWNRPAEQGSDTTQSTPQKRRDTQKAHVTAVSGKRSSTGAFWMRLIVIGVYIAAVIAFAIQTWNLVDTILPADNQFMKVATVVCLDVMSIIFALTEMVYPFYSRAAKQLAMGMWLITFIGALFASIIYMYLSSIHVINGVLDMHVLVWAYGIIVFVMAADVLAITVGIRMEYGAYEMRERGEEVHTDQPTVYSPPQIDTNQLLLTLLTQQLQLQGGSQQGTSPLAKKPRIKVEEE